MLNAFNWLYCHYVTMDTVCFLFFFFQANRILSTTSAEEQIMKSVTLTQKLVQATLPQNHSGSLLPNDLEASSSILSSVIEVLESNDNGTDTVSMYLCTELY